MRKECLRGCPEDPAIRSTVWKILLNHLPLQTSLWQERFYRTRNDYAKFAEDLINIAPSQYADHVSIQSFVYFVKPLNCDPKSVWREYFEDNAVIVQINKDCRRLYPELDFFRRATEFPCNAAVSPKLCLSALRSRVTTELTRVRSIGVDFYHL